MNVHTILNTDKTITSRQIECLSCSKYRALGAPGIGQIQRHAELETEIGINSIRKPRLTSAAQDPCIIA